MQNLLLWAAVAGALLVVVLAVWLRGFAVSPDYHRTAPLPESGTLRTAGGYFTTRTPNDPDAAFSRLAAVIEASPRTHRLAGDLEEGHLSFVTRTPVMGFPDVTNIWRDGERVAIRGHLLIGHGDLGVNRRRIERWLARAGL